MLDKLRKPRVNQENIQEVRPPVDIYETEKGIVLEVDMPGVNRNTLDVELHGDNLRIVGTKNKDQVSDKQAILYQERYPNIEYRREFQLNAEVDRQNIKANYQNGTLTINLVKSKEAQPKKINILS